MSTLPPVHPNPAPRAAPAVRRHGALARLAAWAGLAGALLTGPNATPAWADGALADNRLGATLSDTLAQDVARTAHDAASLLLGSAGAAARIEVKVGRLDPRLKLTPCQTIVPYLPAGARALGASRIGLRCTQGSKLWNVSLPVQVHLWAPSLVASTTLPAGLVLQAQHLVTSTVDLAERSDPALADGAAVLGRTLARGLAAGEALRRGDLKAQLWFNTGDTVRIVAAGPGYAVSSEGQALGPGVAGQNIRVRTEGGRIVTGIASADRRVDLAL